MSTAQQRNDKERSTLLLCSQFIISFIFIFLKMDRNRMSVTSFAVATSPLPWQPLVIPKLSEFIILFWLCLKCVLSQSFSVINSGVNEIQCQIHTTMRMFKLELLSFQPFSLRSPLFFLLESGNRHLSKLQSTVQTRA